MTGSTGSAGLALLAIAARRHIRTHGLEKGAEFTALAVSLLYTRLKRRWVRQVCRTYAPRAFGRSLDTLLNAYVRQEARRHTHQILAGIVPGPKLAAQFVTLAPGDLDHLKGYRGAILLGAHFGFLPYAPLALSAHALPTRLVMERAVCRRFPWTPLGLCSTEFCRYLEDDTQVVPTGGAFPKLRRSLAEGERVCILGDVGHRYAANVSLLGRPARFATGPYRLAREAGVPLIPYTLLPEGELGYRLTLRDPLDPHLSEPDLQAAYVAGLELALQQCPEAWSILPWYLPSS